MQYRILLTRKGISQLLTSDGYQTLLKVSREGIYTEPGTTKGAKFSFFESYYVDDTVFLLLSREELETASKLIVSHFRRFGLIIHTGSRRKESTRNRRPFTIQGLDGNHQPLIRRILYSTRTASGSNFVPDLSDTEDITERLTQGRKLFGAMRKQLLCNKQIPIDIRRRVYQATVVNIALWGCESWALKEADRCKQETFHHKCFRKMCGWTMCDIH
jgi:hypothetical protein